MKISNEERREVAAKLRETEPFEYGGEKWYDEGKILDALDLSFDNVPSIYDPEKVMHLADLIDRQTCCNVSGDQNRFECSECGFEMPTWDGDGGWMAFYFCPNCGAKVVSDED